MQIILVITKSEIILTITWTHFCNIVTNCRKCNNAIGYFTNIVYNIHIIIANL